MFEYYCSCLDRKETKCYYEVLSSLQKCKPCVKTDLSREEGVAVYRKVLLDHPEIFWTGELKTGGNSTGTVLYPSYRFAAKQIGQLSGQLEKRAENIVSGAIGKSDAEKVEFVHGFILDSVTYTALKKNYSHEIFGVLNSGIGVCEGIAKTVQYLLSILSVDTLTVVCEPDARNLSHAWNIIYLNGRPLHYDMTFDLSEKERNSHRFFGLTDSQIFANHRTSIFDVPECL